HYFTTAIQRGYRAALSKHQIAFDPDLCAQGEFHIQSGYDAMRRILGRKTKPDAVFANDEMAFGAMRAIKEAGLKIPEDISVFGFDNLALSQQTEPAMSTVDLDYEYMGRTAVRKIMENSESTRIVAVRIILPVRLVLRQSTREHGTQAIP
ncbi:unnamed protein product, partial [marine sediment metagenome]